MPISQAQHSERSIQPFHPVVPALGSEPRMSSPLYLKTDDRSIPQPTGGSLGHHSTHPLIGPLLSIYIKYQSSVSLVMRSSFIHNTIKDSHI